MAGLLYIVFMSVLAVFGSVIRPDTTKDANRQILEVARQKPGFKCHVLKVHHNRTVEQPPFYKKLFFGGAEIQYAEKAVYAYEWQEEFLIVELFNGQNEKVKGLTEKINIADILYPLDAQAPISIDINRKVNFTTIDGEKHKEDITELRQRVLAENFIKKTYFLGTDGNGRDMLSRLIGGTTVSLLVGFFAVLISLLLGLFMGATAGFFKGWIDRIIMWIINVVWSIPTLLLVIAISMSFGKDYKVVFIAVGLTMWVEVARIVRGQVLSVREKEFIQAGRSLGFSNFRLITKHVLPNVWSPVIVIAAANFATAIIIEAGLSYLGIGTQPPTPSWGSMIAEYKAYINTDMAYLPILPGIAIVLLVLAFMLVGNGLRDAMEKDSIDLEITRTAG